VTTNQDSFEAFHEAVLDDDQALAVVVNQEEDFDEFFLEAKASLVEGCDGYFPEVTSPVAMLQVDEAPMGTC
jgi:hypothetical protein